MTRPSSECNTIQYRVVRRKHRLCGLVDGYYSLNFNHPASRNNNLRYFDAKANQFSLNMAKLTAEHNADPIGFKLDTIFGRAPIVSRDRASRRRSLQAHLQAYVSVKPASWKGVQFDFGKFVTAAGAEVTETHLNWNYSRGFLYANGRFTISVRGSRFP